MPEHWQPIAKRKQEQRDSRIPKQWRLQIPPADDVVNVLDIPRTCGILTPHEIDITENYDATALAQAIASKKLKCVDVTRAFCKVGCPPGLRLVLTVTESRDCATTDQLPHRNLL
jgi:amidase